MFNRVLKMHLGCEHHFYILNQGRESGELKLENTIYRLDSNKTESTIFQK